MTNISTKTLINFLTFDPKLKLELLESYDTLPIDEQVRITRAVWGAFDDYQELKVQENFEKGLLLADKNSSQIDNDYYKKINEQTEKEIDEALANSQQSADLTGVRKSMEQIVREINASKTPQNKQNTP